MIANNYVIIMVLYPPLNDYGSPYVVSNIQGYLGIMKTLYLYTIDHNNIFSTTMLPYLFIDNLIVMAHYIEVISSIKCKIYFLIFDEILIQERHNKNYIHIS